MLRSVRRAGAVAGLLALAAVTAFGVPATAAPCTAAPGKLTVVAEGLNNPRGIGFGPDGALYGPSPGRAAPASASPAPKTGRTPASAAPAR